MKHLLRHVGYLVVSGTILVAAACGNAGTGADSTTDTVSMMSGDAGSSDMSGTITTTRPAQGDTVVAAATTASNSTQSDVGFVSDAIAGNMAEIAAHKAAVSRAENKEVKMHAQHMLTDHSKLGDGLKAYARKKSYSIPTDIPSDKKAAMDAVNGKAKGAAWDKAYVDQQVKDHQETIAKFEAAEKAVVDPELKNMITAALPTLRSHLQMVQDLQGKMK